MADRLYGIAAFLVLLMDHFSKVPGEFLVRVRGNLKPKMVARLGDGSALVEAKVSKGRARILVREIRGRVRRPGGSWVEVRFWTSLLDWKAHPARELLALYARRWEPFGHELRAEWQELMDKELKVDMRQAELLRSHTVETAAQEVAHSAALRAPAALVIAHAMLAQQRLGAARFVEEDVLRISPSAGSGP